MATTIPAHIVILEHPDFVGARQSANWVDTELDLSVLDSATGPAPPEGTESGGRPARPAVAQARTTAWRSRRGVPSISTWSARSAVPSASAIRDGEVLATMPGTIVRMLVSVGDRVLADDGICVIEAMKMENVVQASLAGSVTEIKVAPGEAVESGTPIAVIAGAGLAVPRATNVQTTGARV